MLNIVNRAIEKFGEFRVSAKEDEVSKVDGSGNANTIQFKDIDPNSEQAKKTFNDKTVEKQEEEINQANKSKLITAIVIGLVILLIIIVLYFVFRNKKNNNYESVETTTDVTVEDNN